MKTTTLRVEEAQKLILYSDPEFGAFMWEEVESDPYNADGEDVMVVDMRPGDLFEAEWLGFELIDDQNMTNVKLTHVSSSGKQVQMSYQGWLPKGRIKF